MQNVKPRQMWFKLLERSGRLSWRLTRLTDFPALCYQKIREQLNVQLMPFHCESVWAPSGITSVYALNLPKVDVTRQWPVYSTDEWVTWPYHNHHSPTIKYNTWSADLLHVCYYIWTFIFFKHFLVQLKRKWKRLTYLKIHPQMLHNCLV